MFHVIFMLCPLGFPYKHNKLSAVLTELVYWPTIFLLSLKGLK